MTNSTHRADNKEAQLALERLSWRERISGVAKQVGWHAMRALALSVNCPMATFELGIPPDDSSVNAADIEYLKKQAARFEGF